MHQQSVVDEVKGGIVCAEPVSGSSTWTSRSRRRESGTHDSLSFMHGVWFHDRRTLRLTHASSTRILTIMRLNQGGIQCLILGSTLYGLWDDTAVLRSMFTPASKERRVVAKSRLRGLVWYEIIQYEISTKCTTKVLIHIHRNS